MNPQINALKNAFPFRLGTTSYILPADIVPNVKFLGPLVDDVELVLFESADISNLPDADAIAKLDELKQTHGISYTVHLPLDIELGSPDEAERQRSVEKCLQVVDITEPLDPFAHIVHFHGEQRCTRPAEDLERWKNRLDRSVGQLLSGGLEADQICVETLDYPFEHVAEIVSRHGLSVCIDIGHLLLYGYSVQEHVRDHLDRCRVVHIHGIHRERDHQHIGLMDPDILRSVLERLTSADAMNRVLTIEVFGQEDFEESIEVLADFGH
mgnify:CR=1 FL=1